MPAIRNIVPSRGLHVMIPGNIAAQMDQYLWSDLEGRIPYRAAQRFFTSLLSWFFSTQELDLSPFLGTFPGSAVIRGNEYALTELKRHLTEAQRNDQPK